MGQRRRNLLGSWHHALVEVPEPRYRPNRDVEGAIRLRAVRKRAGNELGRLGLHHNRRTLRGIDARYVAVLTCAREVFLKPLAAGNGGIELLLRHDPTHHAGGVEAEEGALQLVGGRGRALGCPTASQRNAGRSQRRA